MVSAFALNSCRPSIQGLVEVPGHVSGLGKAWKKSLGCLQARNDYKNGPNAVLEPGDGLGLACNTYRTVAHILSGLSAAIEGSGRVHQVHHNIQMNLDLHPTITCLGTI